MRYCFQQGTMPLLWLLCQKLKEGKQALCCPRLREFIPFRSSGLAFYLTKTPVSVPPIRSVNVNTSSVPVKILQNKRDREVEISDLEFNPSLYFGHFNLGSCEDGLSFEAKSQEVRSRSCWFLALLCWLHVFSPGGCCSV